MAQVTGNRRPIGHGVAAQGPVGLGLGEHRAFALQAVTAAAGIAVADEARMPAVPEAGVINIVQPVRAAHAASQAGAVTGGALGDYPAMPLDLGSGDIVIG